ncbi:MAG: ATPase domain-containing protein [Candidatus Eremiobacteraeota bacterium]|nr:ATPase domain-containing protein [Candidatus Eremiobacteraeota bacterium]
MNTGTEGRLSTGVKGIDEILKGGLIKGNAYLLRGGPGAGKTVLGMHFLTAAAVKGQKALFITLVESTEKIRFNARAMAFTLDRIDFLDVSPTKDFFVKEQMYDLFSPADVERDPITQSIVAQVQALKPVAVFVDTMTQFRYLSPDPFQFRKQIVSFMRFLQELECTVLFTSEQSAEAPDDHLQFIADGIMDLSFSGCMRHIKVTKFRGSDFLPGAHSMRLSGKGMEVFPIIIPEEYTRPYTPEIISSGVPGLDSMLHGGIERGTVTIITGPCGVGKTTSGLLFMKEAATRGERSVFYTFEESRESILHRSEAIKIPVASMLKNEAFSLVKIEALQYTASELTSIIRREVEEKNARVICLDSVSGYRLALKGEDMITQMHALTRYLMNMGVTVILINEVESITGDFRATEIGISYLADNIIFLRYLEMAGELRKAIGVLKKRLSDHEKIMRELEITAQGLRIGKPLTSLRGILSGMPTGLETIKGGV